MSPQLNERFEIDLDITEVKRRFINRALNLVKDSERGYNPGTLRG
jgi:hypothetical protein